MGQKSKVTSVVLYEADLEIIHATMSDLGVNFSAAVRILVRRAGRDSGVLSNGPDEPKERKTS